MDLGARAPASVQLPGQHLQLPWVAVALLAVLVSWCRPCDARIVYQHPAAPALPIATTTERVMVVVAQSMGPRSPRRYASSVPADPVR